MKKFKVTTAHTILDARGEAVALRDTTVVVAADYFRLQDGVLIFRTEKRGAEQYNPAVRVFAPGYWLDVSDASDEPSSDSRAEPSSLGSGYEREIDLSHFDKERVA